MHISLRGGEICGSSEVRQRVRDHVGRASDKARVTKRVGYKLLDLGGIQRLRLAQIGEAGLWREANYRR